MRKEQAGPGESAGCTHMEETNIKSPAAEAVRIPLLKRAIFTIVGIFILATGVSAVTIANLGTATVSTVPFVLNYLGMGTIGMLEMGINLVTLVIQLILLKGRMKPLIILVQVLLAVGIGVGIDAIMPVLQTLLGTSYLSHLTMLAFGIVMTGLGISFMVQSQMMMPLDALVDLLARINGKSFGFVKTIFDVGLTAITCVIGLVFAHTIVGVREGTVLCALLCGLVSNLFIRLLRPVLKMA